VRYDITLIAVGLVLLWWARMPAADPGPRAPRWSNVTQHRAAQMLQGLGYGLTGVGTVNLILDLTDDSSVWLRVLWLFVGVILGGLVDAVILLGPRRAWRQRRWGGTLDALAAGHHPPSKSRASL
jgi:hypothetical protein